MTVNTRVEREYFAATTGVLSVYGSGNAQAYGSALDRWEKAEEKLVNTGRMPHPLDDIGRLVNEGMTARNFKTETIGLWEEAPRYAKQEKTRYIRRTQPDAKSDLSWNSPWANLYHTIKNALLD
ncbi:MAG: hypothetical protein ABIA62_06045 [Candidatus Woesearchaeota archaeon]